MNVQETEINRKVSELLSKMTLEEKVAQMTQMTVTNFEEKGKPSVFDMVKLRTLFKLSFRLDVKCSQSWLQRYNDGKK
jgi:predicted transcriptional regulator